MNLNHLKKIKLTNTHKGILAGLGLLVLIVGIAYFFYPVVEGLEGRWQPRNSKDLNEAIRLWAKNKNDAIKKYGHISTWDTSKITSMAYLFSNMPSDFNEDISGWNTGNVTTMEAMFSGREKFNQDISGWDTKNVTNMKNMFRNAYEFNQNIGSWNTSKVTIMAAMFARAYKFNGNIVSWDTSKVEDINSMFFDARSFNRNIKGWDVSSVVGTDRVPAFKYMFYGATLMNKNYNARDTPSKAWFTAKIFRPKTNKGFKSALRDWKTNKSLASDTYGDISLWDTSNITDMSLAFYNNTKFNDDISAWNTSNVTNMNGMFSGAEQFNQNISGWNTRNVTDMKSMFNYALSFEGDISKWNTTNVTNMGGMFLGASKFNSNIIGWDVSNVKQMEYMFAYAESFNRNIKSWNVKSVTKFDKMFLGARLMKENFNAPDTPSKAWFTGIDTGNPCNDNLNRFLQTYPNGSGSEVTGIHLSGNWLTAFTPKSPYYGILYHPQAKWFKLNDDLVVFVAKHRGRFKMVGYNFCKSMNGKEAFIENRILPFDRAPFNDINRVEAARWAWNNATLKSNNYSKLWANQESIPGYTPQGDYYAVSFANTYGYKSRTTCRKNFNMFKKPILSGSEVEQQRKLESATFSFFYRPYTLSNSQSVIIYCFFDNSKNRKVATYENDWTRDRKWYMAAYDFCQMPPKLLEIRTRDLSYGRYSTLEPPKKNRYWTGFARLRNLWNESYTVSPDSNKVKIELQRK